MGAVGDVGANAGGGMSEIGGGLGVISKEGAGLFLGLLLTFVVTKVGAVCETR